MTTRPWWAILGTVAGAAFFFTGRLYLGTGWLWFFAGFAGWICLALAGLVIQLEKDGAARAR